MGISPEPLGGSIGTEFFPAINTVCGVIFLMSENFGVKFSVAIKSPALYIIMK